MKRLWAALVLALAAGARGAPPPYHSGDPGTEENFQVIYNQMATHVHDGNGTAPLSESTLFRNRIINGDMRIDQRNAGAAVTVNSTADFFAADRFGASGTATDGVFTLQQQTAVVPDGFRHAVKATVTTADASITAAQYYFIKQNIEGYNIADAGFGTTWAKKITVSFWVYSSVTGNFAISFRNAAINRSYVTSYAINTANTWEQKTITITADTTGTWEIGNLNGVRISWALGLGSDFNTTQNAWAAGNYLSYSGATNLIATLNATWYITGVQVELGDTATAFEHRSIGTELTLCQRYFRTISDLIFGGYNTGGDQEFCVYTYSPMRASPTFTFVSPAYANASGAAVITTNINHAVLAITITTLGNGFIQTNATVAIEL